MKKLAIASALLATFAFAGTAQAYQAEVGGSITHIDWDNADSSTGFGVDGTYYFNPVQVKNSPLNEAAFLNRASNVNGGLSYSDSNNIEQTVFAAGIEYFVPNTDFYLSAGINHLEIETPFAEGDSTGYSAEVGYLPAPGLLVAAGFVGQSVDDGDDEIDPTIRAKYVTQMGGYDVNFEAGTSFGDIDYYNLGADVYLDKTLSVGAGFSSSDSDLADDDTFTLRAKKFFNQQVSVEGSVGFGDTANTFGVRGAYRF